MQVSWKINMVVSALITVGVYLAADTVLEFKWWVDMLIALLFGGIFNQLIFQDKKEDHEIEVAPGITRKELKDTLARGREWTARIAALAGQIGRKRPEAAAEIQKIEEAVAALFENFEKDPKDLTTTNAQRFISDHLPRAHRFIETYTGLAGAGHLTENEQLALADMEKRITLIRQSFSKHLEGFRNSDFHALQVEGKTMETIYRLDI